MDRSAFEYDTAVLNQVLCDGRYPVTAEAVEKFRRLLGYADPASPEAPASMGLVYGLRLGWEHQVFPPGAIRVGDEDVFQTSARVGDELLTELRIIDRFERKGRRFLGYEMRTTNQRAELICSVTFTAIVP